MTFCPSTSILRQGYQAGAVVCPMGQDLNAPASVQSTYSLRLWTESKEGRTE